MLLEYYGLIEQPFGVTPDTRFLYLNHMYREALGSLWYGVREGRGFLSLIADPGMGKTTLLFQLLQRLRRTSARTVFIFQTCCDPTDLIRYLLHDLGIVPASDVASMHYQLNDVLVREANAGRRFVLVIDEAQNLSQPTLESIRLLSNFETSQGKLVQIILAGQRQLVTTLMHPGMLQLTQRISVANFLDPLDVEEVSRYVSHRLGVAGYEGKPLFTQEALRLISKESGGIPRNINNLCFGALSTAFAVGQKRIDGKIIAEVAGDQSLRALQRRLYPSSGFTPQALDRSGVTVNAPRLATDSRKAGRGWYTSYAWGITCLVIVLLVLTPGLATSKGLALNSKVITLENIRKKTSGPNFYTRRSRSSHVGRNRNARPTAFRKEGMPVPLQPQSQINRLHDTKGAQYAKIVGKGR